MNEERPGRTKQVSDARPLGKGGYLLALRLPQFARINIPLPNRMNDPNPQSGDDFPLSTLIAGAWSIVAALFPSGDFQSTIVVEGKENSPVNTFPNRGVTAPAATVMVKIMMAIFTRLRFT